MIKKITIKNFQAHEVLEVDLSPTITTFVGPSDAGKSSVIRAIRWAAHNTPSGDAFRRNGSKETSVALHIDDKVVTRIKSKKANSYKIDDDEYVAFGSKPPGPVRDLLNLTDLNFQGQYDPAYWLSSSAGQVSKDLNRVVDLDCIDTILSKALARTRKKKLAIDVCEDRIEEAAATVKETEWVCKAKKQWEKLVRQEEEVSKVAAKITSLQAGIKAVESITTQSKSHAKRLKDAQAYQTKYKKAFTAGQEAAKLAAAIDDANRLNDSIEQNTKDLKKAATKLKQLMKGKCPICQKPLVKS